MGPKPKKLTKKQEMELEEKRKEEAKLEKLRELERKRLEEERNRKIEEKNRKIKSDINAHQEELQIIEKERRMLESENESREKLILDHYSTFIKYLDWNSYSDTEKGYLNVRNERELTEFIHYFKERMENSFYYNFTFKERNIPEEMQYFDYLIKHFTNLISLFYESKATDSKELEQYCVKYFNQIVKINLEKINYMTRYFIENFEKIKDMHINPAKYKLGQQSTEKTQNNWIDMCIEWPSPKKSYIVGYFCNNENKQREASILNFKHVPCKIFFLPKQCSLHSSVIRFIYTCHNELEYTYKQYYPYVSVGGLFRLDFIKYPPKNNSHGKWEVKEMTTFIQKIELNNPKEGFTQQSKMTVNCYLDKKLYLFDVGDKMPLFFGTFNEKDESWSVNSECPIKLEIDESDGRRIAVYTELTELHHFSLFLDKRYLYPYKSWYLRSVIRQCEVLDYEKNRKELKTLFIARIDIESKQIKLFFIFYTILAPRLHLTFEIDDDYVTLVKNSKTMKDVNELDELSYLIDKKMKLENLILELKNSGILLCPSNADIIYTGLVPKNKDSVERAILSFVQSSKSFAVKSHELNKKVSSDIVIVKIKPNPENDDYFYDDEPKDWVDMGTFPNKLALGRVEEIRYKDDLKENELLEDFPEEMLKKKFEFIYEKPARTQFPNLIEEHPKFGKYYNTVSEYKIQPGYIHNLSNFLRVTGISHFP